MGMEKITIEKKFYEKKIHVQNLYTSYIFFRDCKDWYVISIYTIPNYLLEDL